MHRVHAHHAVQRVASWGRGRVWEQRGSGEPPPKRSSRQAVRLGMGWPAVSGCIRADAGGLACATRCAAQQGSESVSVDRDPGPSCVSWVEGGSDHRGAHWRAHGVRHPWATHQFSMRAAACHVGGGNSDILVPRLACRKRMVGHVGGEHWHICQRAGWRWRGTGMGSPQAGMKYMRRPRRGMVRGGGAFRVGGRGDMQDIV